MQYFILLKKNFTWYKRNWKTSCCELFLPIIFIFLTFYLRTQIEIIEIPKLDIPRIRLYPSASDYENIPEMVLSNILKKCGEDEKKGGRIALAPKNEITLEIEKLLKPFKTEIIYFEKDSEIENYTQSPDYTSYFPNGTRKQLCYAITFSEYNPETLSFDYNLRYNISSGPSSSDHYKPSLPYKIPYRSEDLQELQRSIENGNWILQFLIEGFILKKYSGIAELDFGVQKMISEEYKRAEYLGGLGFACVICFVLIMLFVYLRTIGFVVGEKESFCLQNMENMGMERFYYFFSVFSMQYFIHFFYGFLFSGLLKIGVFVKVDFFIILFAYWLSLANVIGFAFFVSCFFSSTKKGIIFGLVLFFVLFMAWFLKGTFADGGTGVIILLALSPITSLSNLLDGFLILEGVFINYEFSDLYNNTSSNFKGIWFFIINIIEIIIYFILGFYFFHVVSNKDGINYHPLFFLGYPKKNKNEEMKIKKNEETVLIDNKNKKYFEEVDEKLKSYETQNKTLIIKNLTKSYKKKKICGKKFKHKILPRSNILTPRSQWRRKNDHNLNDIRSPNKNKRRNKNPRLRLNKRPRKNKKNNRHMPPKKPNFPISNSNRASKPILHSKIRKPKKKRIKNRDRKSTKRHRPVPQAKLPSSPPLRRPKAKTLRSPSLHRQLPHNPPGRAKLWSRHLRSETSLEDDQKI